MIFPKVTLVTPTFNRAEYLEETIRSVLDQNYPNLEYIIVDGGSTNPEVFDIIRKYEHRLAWWISEPDKGHAHAIRKGFDRSTGEVMNWLCSDDTLLPGSLHALGKAFTEHPEADVVFGHHSIIDEKSRVIHNGRAAKFHKLDVVLGTNAIHQASVFWRRSLYDRAGRDVGGPNLEYAVYSPDVDLFMRFVKTSQKWFRIDYVLSTFRMHSEQTTTREGDLCHEHVLIARRKHFPFWAKRQRIFMLARRFYQVRRYALLLLQGDARFAWAKFRHRVIDC
jgi:glycosyltransferase involved in cell wall biosynthesis